MTIFLKYSCSFFLLYFLSFSHKDIHLDSIYLYCCVISFLSLYSGPPMVVTRCTRNNGSVFYRFLFLSHFHNPSSFLFFFSFRRGVFMSGINLVCFCEFWGGPYVLRLPHAFFLPFPFPPLTVVVP